MTVLAPVREHLEEPPMRFERRLQDVRMEPVLDDRPSSLPKPVQAASDAHCQAAHPVRERDPVRDLAQEVDVIVLHRPVNDLETWLPAAPCDRLSNHCERSRCPQMGQIPLHPERDEDRVPRGDLGPRVAWQQCPLAFGFAPRSPARASVPEERQLTRRLRNALHP